MFLLLPLCHQGYRCFSPLFPFSMEVLRVINVAPSQLFPSSWGYINTFKMVNKYLVIKSTMGVFLSIYTSKLTKGSWVSFSSDSGKSLSYPGLMTINYGRKSFFMWGEGWIPWVDGKRGCSLFSFVIDGRPCGDHGVWLRVPHPQGEGNCLLFVVAQPYGLLQRDKICLGVENISLPTYVSCLT